MARIPEFEIERLKQEISLERLVTTQGIELKRHGADLLGLCPFHDDREPSLVVSPKKNLWHCLGACQTGGSVIDWVIQTRGVSFRHAVELLRDEHPSLAAPLECVFDDVLHAFRCAGERVGEQPGPTGALVRFFVHV
jgi:DNA primase